MKPLSKTERERIDCILDRHDILFRIYQHKRLTRAERKTRNKNMIIAVLNGATFEQAAKVYGFNSRQASEWIFKASVLTPVKFFLSSEIDEIKKNGNDINAMREQWSKSMEVPK